MKILDADSYINEYSVFEKDENQKILDLISFWIEDIAYDIKKKIILDYYHNPGSISKWDTLQINDMLDFTNNAYETVIDNMKYVPIMPPLLALQTMVDEVINELPDDIRIENVYYKTIPEFNFTEAKMKKPDYYEEAYKRIEKKIDKIPKVLSMTTIYNDNPLMWPLILHEYGHTLFSNFKKNIPYQNLHDKVKIYSNEHTLKLDREQIDSLISEVFSDILALVNHKVNYVLAFYFHEIFRKDMKRLIGIKKNDNNKYSFKIEDHPPSYIRLLYLLDILHLAGFDTKDQLVDKLLESQKEFDTEMQLLIQENIKDKVIDDSYFSIIDLFKSLARDIYENIKETSLLSEEIGLDYELINKLYLNLQNHCPIGTIYSKNTDLKIALQKPDIFNIEENNTIINIIYSGWKYLVIDIIDDFYEKSNYNDYLPKRKIKEEELTEIVIDNKLLKFNKEYLFLLSNLRYSIETSMIVNYYLGDKND